MKKLSVQQFLHQRYWCGTKKILLKNSKMYNGIYGESNY